MKVIISDPISEDGLKIFKDNNIDVINANGESIDKNLSHIKLKMKLKKELKNLEKIWKM